MERIQTPKQKSNMEQCTFVIDIDDTICKSELVDGRYDYENSKPIISVIERIRELKKGGHTIILFTARGMRTHGGNLDEIYEKVAPVLDDWLRKHNVPFDQLIMGKPWGPNVFYVDDRALSPMDFAFQTIDDYHYITNMKKI